MRFSPREAPPGRAGDDAASRRNWKRRNEFSERSAEASAAFATSASASAATRNSCAAPGRSPVARKCATDASRDSYTVVQSPGESETTASFFSFFLPPAPFLFLAPLVISRCWTTYPRTTEPLRLVGGRHRTLADSGVIREKESASGGSGGAASVRNARGSEGGPNPTSLPARTRARIVSPGSRPDTVARASNPRYTTIQPAASESSSDDARFFFFLLLRRRQRRRNGGAEGRVPEPAPAFDAIDAVSRVGTRRASRTYTSGVDGTAFSRGTARERLARRRRMCPSPSPSSSSKKKYESVSVSFYRRRNTPPPPPARATQTPPRLFVDWRREEARARRAARRPSRRETPTTVGTVPRRSPRTLGTRARDAARAAESSPDTWRPASNPPRNEPSS